ncbi:biotin transport system ATP-binding protein [Nocardioides alpinus]|uniref:ABC transporter ATP-binding protein n=1 Tax=Nocardioides alpinus TaxID=748909 RepID=A0A1I0XDJ7_9ACTN|nr:ABC transporter ATP-binding protein [Nocardioides alpinus]PKH44273.1 ABC transporter ATP-binding protein [Nocardioides alpinus]SFA98777.1 biotin transport system ATP-binding protein [Nocardioides alpinus]
MPTIQLDAAAVRVPLPGRGEREILAPTTLTLTEHRIGVIGANGSGKSTLARLLNGLVRPSSGRVSIGGRDVVREGAAVRRMVGFCFTDPAAQLVMPTCVEDIELSLRRTVKDSAARRERALGVLAANGLADHAHDSVHSLSGGQRQLLALAGVLALDPTIVVADEPTTLLDRANTRRVGDTLFGLDQQLVLVTHDLELAARCDRVLVVDSSRVVFDGSPRGAVAHYTDMVDVDG